MAMSPLAMFAPTLDKGADGPAIINGCWDFGHISILPWVPALCLRCQVTGAIVGHAFGDNVIVTS